MAEFSVVITTNNRSKIAERGIKSVLAQTHKDYEIILVDDGSLDDTFEVVKKMQIHGVPLVYYRHIRHQRIISRNAGMRLSRFEWIVLMDDDDELYPNYLEEFNKAIEANPSYSVFCCAAQFYKVINGVDTKLRLLPPLKLSDEVPWPHFRSGCITTGQFIFKKECLDKIGYFPHTHTYGDFAIQSMIPGYGWVDPEPPRFPERRVQVMGNPWGDDFYIFYKLTRHYDSFPIKIALYKKNCR